MGGTLARLADRRIGLTVVLATSGEAGEIADPSLATRETLGAVREAEDRASWEALGLSPDLRFLRYPDGRVADVPSEDLVGAFVGILLEVRPHLVVTFGPDGITGHPDHIAVGRAATEAFHVARGQSPEGLERLVYTVLSEERVAGLNEALRARGMDPLDPLQPLAPRGIPAERIGIVVDCSAVLPRKIEALRCHRTQAELEDLPYELWPQVLGTEEFEIAHPERPPGARVLHDVLEGLPSP
ncbi:MAG: 1D-myo-inositol 2-acetamido-2-deoxy-alpha-D-glucopyranoside deacetylase [Actinomycetota bacterium]|nr:MAG: 1D-myo-inositol 2-acetamido-2-deoxy-alpha-D-glucopyranoside deacetylase [Actinomycetota bacterium]